MLHVIIDFFVGIFINHRMVVRRLQREYELFAGGSRVANQVDHLSFITDMLHARASALISHLSIMTAVVFVLTSTNSDLYRNPISSFVISTEIAIYLGLTVLCLRTIKAFGLNKDYLDQADIFDALLKETARKFAAFQFCLSLASLATIVLIALVTAEFINKYWPGLFSLVAQWHHN